MNFHQFKFRANICNFGKPMKTSLLLISVCSLFYSTIGKGQICDFYEDYSDPTPWNFVYVYPGAGGCGDNPQPGTLAVTGGQVNYTDVNDANDTRIWRDIGTPVSDESWTATFDFTPIAIGMDGVPRVGHVIWSLSSGTNCPFNDTWEHCIANDQDGIMIWYLSEYTPADPTTGFYIYAKNELTYVNTAVGDNITALPGQTYYLTFTRESSNYVSLEVYLDPARTDLLDAIECFEIPNNITNLHILQHGNAPWGYYKRVLTGTLDNTCIINNATTSALLTGPTNVCSDYNPIYEITGSGTATVSWLPMAGVDVTEIDPNTISIDNWGGATSATITAVLTGACSVDTLSINVTIDSSSIVDTTITICNLDTVTIYGLEITDAGFYNQTLTTVLGCDSIINITVIESDTIYNYESFTICEGDSIEILGSYVAENTVLSETLTTVGGCDSIHVVTVTIIDAPILSFLEDTVVCTATGIILNPIITDITATISWSPTTDLSCANCAAPFLVTTESGWYYITITNALGCSYTDSVYVKVDLSDWGIPNVFSPNGDGINDYFGPIIPLGCVVENFVIYNRWGAEIFRSTGALNYWDGTYQGIPQEIGAYVYILYANCADYEIQTHGSVTLLR